MFLTTTSMGLQDEIAAVTLKHEILGVIEDPTSSIDEIAGIIIKFLSSDLINECGKVDALDADIVDRFRLFTIAELEALVKYKDTIDMEHFIAGPLKRLRRNPPLDDFAEKRVVYTKLLGEACVDDIIESWLKCYGMEWDADKMLDAMLD